MGIQPYRNGAIMKDPIVITTSDPSATEPVTETVWHCTKEGHSGMLVYSQEIAIDKMGEGFDIEIGTVVRMPQSKADDSE
jgi:hypothetical protein